MNNLQNPFKKLISLVLVLSLVLPYVFHSKAYASTIKDDNIPISIVLDKSEEIYSEQLDLSYRSLNLDVLTNRQQQSLCATGIAVIVGGVLVGYIIGGTITFVTGHRLDWWVAEALRWAYSGVRKVFINNDGSSYGTNSSGYVKDTPHGNWYCPYAI